jgi:hypothetical protein
MASFSLLRALLTHFESPAPPAASPVAKARHQDGCNMFRGGFCDCVPSIESASDLVMRAARKRSGRRPQPPPDEASRDVRLFLDRA